MNMQQFEAYNYSKETFWENIDSARISLGLSKADVSLLLRQNSKQFAVALKAKPTMKLTNAFDYSVAVGLSLDEAVRGSKESRFLKLLHQHSISYTSLPVDSIFRSYPYKALLATFDEFVALCPDSRLEAIITNCFTMAQSELMQFFYQIVGVDSDFLTLFSSTAVADPVDLFGANGLHRELGFYASKHAFAEHIGLTLGQLSRYLNYTENKTRSSNGKRIETVPLLDKVLDICNRLGVGVDELLKPLFVFDDFIDPRLGTAVEESEKMYYFRLSFEHFTNVFQALPVLYPVVNRFCGATAENRKIIYDLSQQHPVL